MRRRLLEVVFEAVACGILTALVLTLVEYALVPERPPSSLTFWMICPGLVGVASGGLAALVVLAFPRRLASSRAPATGAVAVTLAVFGIGFTFRDGRVLLQLVGVRSLATGGGVVISLIVLGGAVATAWSLSAALALVHRRGRSGVLAALVAAATAIAVTRPTVSDRSVTIEDRAPESRDHGSRPSVFFISIDTLRADVLGLYGDTRRLSPSLDRFAERSVAYDACYAASPWTRPSFASALTGLPPHRHLAIAKAVRVSVHEPPFGYSLPLGPDLPWLPQSLSDAGFETVAFQANPIVGRGSGLERGFRTLVMASDLRPHQPIAYSVARRAGVRYAPFEYDWVRWDSERLATVFERWLKTRGRGRGPLFAWINLMEVHEPHVDPAIPRSEIDEQPLYYESDDIEHPGAAEAYLKRAYEAEVVFTDDLVGRLIRRIDSLVGADRAVVIVMSDHGEELFERPGGWEDPLFAGRRYWGHGASLRHEVVRVPLIVRAPGVAPARVSSATSLMDLTPTIAQLCGLRDHDTPAPATYAGQVLPGLGLDVQSSPASRTILIESTNIGLERRALRRGNTRVEWFGPPPGIDVSRIGAVSGRFLSNPKDPESRSLLSSLEELVERAGRMEAEAVKNREQLKRPEGAAEELRALGYVQ
jgi:arylsulfatase A-like enzyme